MTNYSMLSIVSSRRRIFFLSLLYFQLVLAIYFGIKGRKKKLLRALTSYLITSVIHCMHTVGNYQNVWESPESGSTSGCDTGHTLGNSLHVCHYLNQNPVQRQLMTQFIHSEFLTIVRNSKPWLEIPSEGSA